MYTVMDACVHLIMYVYACKYARKCMYIGPIYTRLSVYTR